MKILFYALAAGAGLIGILGLVRVFEQLLVGQGLEPVQLVIAVVGILLAMLWIKRARSFKT
jgi:uncharacterized membrane protein